MPSTRRHRRRITWTIAFALVLASMAPGISRALAHVVGQQAPWAQLCSVDRGARRDTSPPGSLRSPLDHCPCCTLAGDAPALPPATALPMTSALGEAAPSRPLARQVDAARAWPAAQPRAPPVGA